VALVVEEDKALDPMDVGLLCAIGGVRSAQRLSDAVQQPRRSGLGFFRY
jgi:hypothetical protein